ncbi:MAG: hypothetical protein K2W82_17315 [Candidatus Obscuribacterales bacterium]|nr:hypothetical protein [Candidatus Obscuribacterales bacterium]
MFTHHQFINTSITAFLQSLAPQYALLDQARADAEEAKAAHNQTLSEWSDAQTARKGRDKEKAEAHISAILRVRAARTPLYEGLVAMRRFLLKSKELVKCKVDPSDYDKWYQSQIERHNFVCAEQLLIKSFHTYQRLIELQPAFPPELLTRLESNFAKATTRFETKIPELPNNLRSDFDRAVADLMVRLIAEGTYHDNFYHFDIEAETSEVVDAAIENLSGGYWNFKRDGNEEIEATRKDKKKKS